MIYCEIQAVLSNVQHPEHGQVTVPFPIFQDAYEQTIAMLNDLGMGNALEQDCRVDELDSDYPALKRLEGTAVNVEELDYLGEWLDSEGKAAEFQAIANKLDLSDIRDFINLAFRCEQDANCNSGVELGRRYDGHDLPSYIHEPPVLEVEVVSPQKGVTGSFCLPMPDLRLQRTLLRAGADSPDAQLRTVAKELPEKAAEILYLERLTVDDLPGLNGLAKLLGSMPREKRDLLDGVLTLEQAGSLDDVLRIIGGLDQYEIFSRIRTDEELGRFLVDTAPITGKFSFPEEVRPYLDYARIGAEQRNALGGVYTPHGLVKYREESAVQKETPSTITLTLTTSEQSDTLILPAADERLEQAKRALDVEEFAQARITAVKFSFPHLEGLLPLDTVTVEDANTLTLCLQEMEQEDGELLKFCAVLEAEQPGAFTEAVTIAMDRDDYEQVPEEMDEYGKQVLRRIGADDEIIDTIDGYMNFTQLGEDSLEEDGVRRTEFGLVRRLSQPFPPKPEIGQSMM